MYAITKGIDLALWFTILVKRLHKYIYVKDRRAETEDSEGRLELKKFTAMYS